MENPLKQALSYRGEENVVVENTWEWWNGFRTVCDYDKKLAIALIVSHDLPEPEEVMYLLFFSFVDFYIIKKKLKIDYNYDTMSY